MDTERRYWAEPRRDRITATVRAVRDDGVLLDRTIFYPTGGGQPHDTGTLDDGDRTWSVTDVRQADDIVHELDGSAPRVGTEVTAALDWQRRWGLMRHHTAQHVLSAILLEEYDAPTAGNQLYPDRARLDATVDRLDEAVLTHIEELMNDIVAQDRSVTANQWDRATAERELDPERTRLELLPDAVDPVRIVEIEGLDRTACGGLHVASTGEIGTVDLTGRETAGQGRERVRFRVLE